MTFAIITMCTGLSSCNNDDDDVDYSKTIAGAWYSEEEGEGYFFDGEGNGYFFDEYGQDGFTYTLSGNRLTIKEDGDTDTFSLTIEVSGNTIKIKKDGITQIFKKVNIKDFE